MLLWTCILVPICMPFCWVYSKRRIAEPSVMHIFSFSSVSEHTILQSSHVRLHSFPECFSFLFAKYPLYPCEHLVWSAFLILAILMGVQLYLIMVLIYISLMNNDGEHLLFVYWLFGYPLSSLLPILKNWLVRILMYSKDKTSAYIYVLLITIAFSQCFFSEQKFLIFFFSGCVGSSFLCEGFL